jgi:signal peptidase I
MADPNAQWLPEDAATGRKTGRKNRGVLAEFLIVLVQATVIALVVRTFLFQSFNIPSGSLIPTLLVGDYVFVSKYAYGYSKYSFPFNFIDFNGRVLGSEPKRGEIAVFHNTKDQGKDYIKRVIGLPGDRIQMKEAVLYINDVAVKKERIGDFETDKPSRVLRKVPSYRETLPNGISYTIIEVDSGRGYLSHTAEYTVPAGHYFMMGDNREDSQDSRVPSKVGFVPIENFVGRAEMIYFSVNAGIDGRGEQEGILSSILSSNVRWGRMFKGVH